MAALAISPKRFSGMAVRRKRRAMSLPRCPGKTVSVSSPSSIRYDVDQMTRTKRQPAMVELALAAASLGVAMPLAWAGSIHEDLNHDAATKVIRPLYGAFAAKAATLP